MIREQRKMMPSIENIAKNGIYIDNILRRVNDDGIKRKKFMHRMLEEKQLPYKKRWIPTVFLNLPQTFRPKYERPMTRSQRRRSSANKENCSKSKRNEMVKTFLIQSNKNTNKALNNNLNIVTEHSDRCWN